MRLLLFPVELSNRLPDVVRAEGVEARQVHTLQREALGSVGEMTERLENGGEQVGTPVKPGWMGEIYVARGPQAIDPRERHIRRLVVEVAPDPPIGTVGLVEVRAFALAAVVLDEGEGPWTRRRRDE